MDTEVQRAIWASLTGTHRAQKWPRRPRAGATGCTDAGGKAVDYLKEPTGREDMRAGGNQGFAASAEDDELGVNDDDAYTT
eukprot:10638777-Karenia_brevis.AAC.1